MRSSSFRKPFNIENLALSIHSKLGLTRLIASMFPYYSDLIAIYELFLLLPDCPNHIGINYKLFTMPKCCIQQQLTHSN